MQTASRNIVAFAVACFIAVGTILPVVSVPSDGTASAAPFVASAPILA